MNRGVSVLLVVLFVFLCSSGCSTTQYGYREVLYEQKVEKGNVLNNLSLTPDLEEKILALNPEKVSDRDVRDVLSHAPAPRIINIHGGIYPVHLAMESFSQFLIGMGYPETKIRHPKDGSYSYSCYESSEKLAGIIAWFYEKEGMRPMVVGHSQGGMQTVKVLYELSGAFGGHIPVWNPITGGPEERYAIVDPITGADVPVTGVQVSFATAVGAGGFTRFLPNQWTMFARLRKIPDSVDEFTGFYMGLDLLGGDLLGFGGSNKYEPNGKAHVRNVQLPTGYSHVTVPVTAHLVESEEIRAWINNYVPTERPEITATFESSSTNILWAADVWHSIKKHWVLELQRLIRAKQGMKDDA